MNYIFITSEQAKLQVQHAWLQGEPPRLKDKPTRVQGEPLKPQCEPPKPHTAKTKCENLKPIFPEKEYRGLSLNFYIHVSVSELYIPTMSLPFLLEEICGPVLVIYCIDLWLKPTVQYISPLESNIDGCIQPSTRLRGTLWPESYFLLKRRWTMFSIIQ